MNKTQTPFRPPQTPPLDNQQNHTFQFAQYPTIPHLPLDQQIPPQHQSHHLPKTIPFQELTNQTMPNQTPIKKNPENLKLNSLQIPPKYTKITLPLQNQQSKPTPSVLANTFLPQEKDDYMAHYQAPLKLRSPSKLIKPCKSKSKRKLQPIQVGETSHFQANQDSQLNQVNSAKETSNIFTPHSLQNESIQFQKSQHSQNYKLLEITKSDLIAVPTVFQGCSHVMKPIKKNYQIEHVFNRHDSCLFSDPIIYLLPTQKSQIIASEKTSRFLCSEFQISLNKKGWQFPLGTLKSNFVGSVYNFYPANSEAIYFSILFKSELEKSSEYFRYSEVYINKGLVEDEANSNLIAYEEMESLEGLYKKNKNPLNKEVKTEIIKLSAQAPMWSKTQKCYCLKLPKKAIPSSKNTVLVDEDGEEVLKFFKNSYLTYNVTFENPIAWIVAYCYGLVSTDFKIFTQ